MSSLSKSKANGGAGDQYFSRKTNSIPWFSYKDLGKVLGECSLCNRTVVSSRSKTCKFHGPAFDHLRSRYSGDRAALLAELTRIKEANAARAAEEKETQQCG